MLFYDERKNLFELFKLRQAMHLFTDEYYDAVCFMARQYNSQTRTASFFRWILRKHSKHLKFIAR